MNNDIIQSLTGTRPVYGVQMKYKLLKSSVFIGCSFLIGSIFAADEKPDIKSGGGTTVYSTGTNAFSLPSKNIDIILGGHTHTFMEKPTILKNLDGKDVIINQVGWAGLMLGKIDITMVHGTIVANPQSTMLKVSTKST